MSLKIPRYRLDPVSDHIDDKVEYGHLRQFFAEHIQMKVKDGRVEVTFDHICTADGHDDVTVWIKSWLLSGTDAPRYLKERSGDESGMTTVYEHVDSQIAYEALLEFYEKHIEIGAQRGRVEVIFEHSDENLKMGNVSVWIKAWHYEDESADGKGGDDDDDDEFLVSQQLFREQTAHEPGSESVPGSRATSDNGNEGGGEADADLYRIQQDHMLEKTRTASDFSLKRVDTVNEEVEEAVQDEEEKEITGSDETEELSEEELECISAMADIVYANSSREHDRLNRKNIRMRQTRGRNIDFRNLALWIPYDHDRDLNDADYDDGGCSADVSVDCSEESETSEDETSSDSSSDDENDSPPKQESLVQESDHAEYHNCSQRDGKIRPEEGIRADVRPDVETPRTQTVRMLRSSQKTTTVTKAAVPLLRTSDMSAAESEAASNPDLRKRRHGNVDTLEATGLHRPKRTRTEGFKRKPGFIRQDKD